MNSRGVSVIVGTILMIIIAVLLASTFYVMITSMNLSNQKPPRFITFRQERAEGKLVVTYGSSGDLKWSNLIVSPSTVEINDTNNNGLIDAGEYLYNCTGKTVTVSWEPANILLGTWDFT